MSDDLSQFGKTIQQLKYVHASTKLGDLIGALEPNISSSDKFLVKMEIKRLAKPSQRVIDLRDVTKVTCEPVERAGLTHYMDTASAQEFDRELEKYGDLYCLGVYEHVVEFAKKRALHAQKVSSFRAKRIALGDVSQRNEERIYYSTHVALFFTTNLQQCQARKPDMEVVTTDISEKAITVKIEDTNIIIPDEVLVKFTELEEEFLLPDDLFVKYKLFKKYLRDATNYAVFKQDEEQPAATLSASRELIKKCIHNHKRRNRVPVENTVKAVESKIFEQYVAGRQQAIPILGRIKDQSVLPVALLVSDDNRPLVEFLTNNHERSILPSLFSHPLIVPLLQQQSMHFTLDAVVLRYRDKEGNIYFGLFSMQQARHDLAIQQLLARAQEVNGVRLLRLTGASVDTLQGAYIPSSLPDSIGEAFANLNRGPRQKLKKLLTTSNYFFTLQDTSDLLEELGLLSLWKASQQQERQKLQIKPHLALPQQPAFSCATCETNHGDHRIEERFLITTEVMLTGRKRDKKDQSVNATTINISSRGMLVECAGDHPFSEGDDVFVKLELDWGKTSRSFSNQRYRVIRTQSKKIWLAVAGNVAHHDARLYLRKALFQYADLLKVDGSSEPVFGLGKALRNLFASYHPQLFLGYARENHQLYAEALIFSEQSSFPVLADSIPQHVCISMLGQNLVIRDLIKAQLKQIEADDSTSRCVSVIVAASKNEALKTYTLHVESLKREEGKDIHLEKYNSLKGIGRPFVFRLAINTLADISDLMFRDELRYLQRFAKPKHIECVRLLRRSCAIVDVKDITDLFESLVVAR